MKKLSSIRDEFVHFTPKGWYLEFSGGPAVAIDCLELARFLVLNSGRFSLYSNFKEGELISLIDEAVRAFKNVK